MNRDIILAIDQGTTGSTALLIDVTKRSSPEIVGKATREFQQHFPKSGWVEHDLDEIWNSVVLSIGDALASTKGLLKPSNIGCIGITNQRETICVFDRMSGRPLTKAIVWQCRRSAAICDDLRAQGMSESIGNRTGLVLDPYFSGSKIKWLMTNHPVVATEVRSGRAVFGTIDTYILQRLTGGDTYATEASNASRTMLFNIKTGQWDQELLKLFDVPNLSNLPEVRASAGIFGKTRATGFLPDGIPIAGILGDQQAALAGQTCFEPGEAHCT